MLYGIKLAADEITIDPWLPHPTSRFFFVFLRLLFFSGDITKSSSTLSCRILQLSVFFFDCVFFSFLFSRAIISPNPYMFLHVPHARAHVDYVPYPEGNVDLPRLG